MPNAAARCSAAARSSGSTAIGPVIGGATFLALTVAGQMLSALLILLGSAALRYVLLMGPQHLQTLY